MPFSSSFFLSPVYDVEWWFFLPNGLTSLAAATLFGLWRYDDDIWLYGLFAVTGRERSSALLQPQSVFWMSCKTG